MIIVIQEIKIVDLTLLNRLRGIFLAWILFCFNTRSSVLAGPTLGSFLTTCCHEQHGPGMDPLNLAVWKICSSVEVFGWTLVLFFCNFFHQSLIMTLSSGTSDVVTSLAAIGHMLLLCPESFAKRTEHLVKDFVIGHLLLQTKSVWFI